MNLDVRPCGDAAVLVEVDGLDEAVALHAALRTVPPRGLLDLVLAARTVLVKVQPGTDLRALERTIRTLRLQEPAVAGRIVGDIVEIAVDYNGEDLHEVADQTGLTVAQLITAHTSRIWTVAFVGFAPGFGYLVSQDNPLSVARRATPRTTVPSGAVALAGSFSAVYPRTSPGGWQLIGRTDVQVWDLRRSPPALLIPGAAIRFFERK